MLIDEYNSKDSNVAGYQIPFHGEACSALVTAIDESDYQEHQGIKLIQPMVVGQKYQCRMWVSLTELSSFASNKIGFRFSMKPESDINNVSQVYSNNIISDKKNWVLVSGSFIAHMPYTYVFVGNFFEDKNTQLTPVSGGEYDGAYYYIDSISVTPVAIQNVVNVQATSKSGIYTVTGAKLTSTVAITRASGEGLVSYEVTSPSTTIDLSAYGHDTYYILIESNTGEEIRKSVTF